MADRIVQLEDKNGNKVFPISVIDGNLKNVIVSSTDIGEGADLAEGTIYFVV